MKLSPLPPTPLYGPQPRTWPYLRSLLRIAGPYEELRSLLGSRVSSMTDRWGFELHVSFAEVRGILVPVVLLSWENCTQTTERHERHPAIRAVMRAMDLQRADQRHRSWLLSGSPEHLPGARPEWIAPEQIRRLACLLGRCMDAPLEAWPALHGELNPQRFPTLLERIEKGWQPPHPLMKDLLHV